jgi:hypothetical protein
VECYLFLKKDNGFKQVAFDKRVCKNIKLDLFIVSLIAKHSKICASLQFGCAIFDISSISRNTSDITEINFSILKFDKW